MASKKAAGKKAASKKTASKKAAGKQPAQEAGTPLSSILAIADPGDFMIALDKFVAESPACDGVPFARRPETAQMVGLLDEAYSALFSSGMLYMFDWSVGDEFDRINGWCRTIGAMRTVEYFAAAAALCPGERVPANRDRRQELTREFMESDSDPLEQLDDVYREDALAEIPDRLRAHLTRHRAAVEQELATR